MTYKDYLTRLKKKRIFILVFQILIALFFILIWQILSDKKIINPFITSSPKRILFTIINLYKNNNLTYHIFITIKEIILSFIITCFLSIIISIFLYLNETLSKILEPYLVALNSLPKVSLGPIIIIWIGANTKSIITISILISLIVSIETIYNSFKNTDKLKLKLLNTFNASKKDILMHLVIPSNKSTIISTFKINISMCLIGTITGEFLTSKAGIGYLIIYGSQVFNLDIVISGIFILLIISVILYKIISFIIKE